MSPDVRREPAQDLYVEARVPTDTEFVKRVVLAGLVAGCGFTHGALQSSGGDADVDDSATSDTLIDARLDGPTLGTGTCTGKIWFADFTADPTAQNLNGDNTNDWALRSGTFDADQLVNGVWTLPDAGPPLDSQPKQNFDTRTIVDVRMRSTSTSGARGAVFFINVGFDGTGTFVPLFVDVKKQSNNTQTAYVITKNAASVEQVSATVSSLSLGFVDVHLDINPGALTFTYMISDGGSASAAGGSLGRVTAIADDRWATVVAFSGAAEFDRVRVEVCP